MAFLAAGEAGAIAEGAGAARAAGAARGAGTARTVKAPKAGRPKPTAPRSRAQKLEGARAAGRSGKPAPKWIDDTETLDAYTQGSSEFGSGTGAASSDVYGGGVDTSGLDAPGDNPPATSPATTGAAKDFSKIPPLPDAPAPAKWRSLPGKARSVGNVAVSAQGDAAGALLGLLGAAYLTNVIRGTGSDWLRAKFLNDTGSGSAPANGLKPTAGGTPSTSAPPQSAGSIPKDPSHALPYTPAKPDAGRGTGPDTSGDGHASGTGAGDTHLTGALTALSAGR